MMRDQAKIDAAQQKIEAERAVLKKANDRFSRIFNAQRKIIEAEEAKIEMTLERALETFLPGSGIENVAGYKWLQDRTWKGEWSGMGIMTSGYWVATGQRVVQVGIPHSATDEKLEGITKLLNAEIIPILKPGVFGDDRRLKADYENAKVIDVFDDDCGASHDYKLMILPNGEVHVTNARYYYSGDGSTIYKGDLRGALTVVRNNLSYGD
jgi:hypothetical protein